MVVVGRNGAPPLRFAGCVICSVSDGRMAIRIWRAKAGGFVLAHSIEAPGAETASRHALAEEVMLALEGYCRDLGGAGELPVDLQTFRRLHVADLLEEIARLSDWRRRFRNLVGEALDAFEDQLSAGSPQHEEGVE
jgi:hypothetical protein